MDWISGRSTSNRLWAAEWRLFAVAGLLWMVGVAFSFEPFHYLTATCVIIALALVPLHFGAGLIERYSAWRAIRKLNNRLACE